MIPFELLYQIRHELHRSPELSGSEMITAEKIFNYLNTLAPDVLETNIGGHGVIAIFRSVEEGPVYGFRAELDAVPVGDDIAKDYSSLYKNVGHKCGHDGHITILLGLASILSEQRNKLRGSVILLFQPSEENGRGAEAVLNSGILKKYPIDRLFALHNIPGYERGIVIVKDGVFTKASRGMSIELTGKSSHAAHPEDGISPAAAIAELLNELPKLPAKLQDGSDALITIVYAHLGEKTFGTAPGKGELMVTLRTCSNDDMKKLIDACKEDVMKRASYHGLEVKIEWDDCFDAVVNCENSVNLIRDAALKAGLSLIEIDEPFPWSEDFGKFSRVSESAFFGLGAGICHPQLHHSDYDFPDELIQVGIKLLGTICNLNCQ